MKVKVFKWRDKPRGWSVREVARGRGEGEGVYFEYRCGFCHEYLGTNLDLEVNHSRRGLHKGTTYSYLMDYYCYCPKEECQILWELKYGATEGFNPDSLVD